MVDLRRPAASWAHFEKNHIPFVKRFNVYLSLRALSAESPGKQMSLKNFQPAVPAMERGTL
jgi:hypothetical protein